MTHYLSLNDYCRQTFGHKLYRLSLDGGMTCPNRDGTVGCRGCIFCSEKGSGEFSEKQCGSIYEQIENAKKRVEKKNKGGRYIAYFQSYTNTYADTDYLRRIFTEAINHPDIDVLSVATRPDCLDDCKISLLSELNEIKPVWVELGLQTSDEKSAEYIRRGYDNSVYTEAVGKLKAAGIKVITHIILGLPNETEETMLNSIRFACNAGTDGLKLHMLYISSDSDIAEDYEKGLVRCFEKDEYIGLLCRLIPQIPENIVIHRLTGDADKKTLVAPMWSANKKDVLNSLNRELDRLFTVQGKNTRL